MATPMVHEQKKPSKTLSKTTIENYILKDTIFYNAINAFWTTSIDNRRWCWDSVCGKWTCWDSVYGEAKACLIRLPSWSNHLSTQKHWRSGSNSSHKPNLNHHRRTLLAGSRWNGEFVLLVGAAGSAPGTVLWAHQRHLKMLSKNPKSLINILERTFFGMFRTFFGMFFPSLPAMPWTEESPRLVVHHFPSLHMSDYLYDVRSSCTKSWSRRSGMWDRQLTKHRYRRAGLEIRFMGGGFLPRFAL